MTEFIDSEGNAVEGFTKEEVDIKIEEAKTGAKTEVEKELSELKTSLETIKTEKEELEKKGGKLTDEDKNWENVRTMIKERDGKIDGLEKKIQDLTEGVSLKLDEKKVSDIISSLSGGNIDVAEKIKFHFNRIRPDLEAEKDPAKKEEDFKKRMEDAYTLATGGKLEGGLGGSAISSGGGFIPPVKGSKEKISEGGKEVGKKMGLSDEEMKTI